MYGRSRINLATQFGYKTRNANDDYKDFRTGTENSTQNLARIDVKAINGQVR